MRLTIGEFDNQDLPTHPGVYVFLDESDKPLYVGKASILKNRLLSYFRKSGNSAKTTAMVAKAKYLEYIITHTENEALLLENNLIKTQNPPYNILFRDDKSYPYIHITNHQFPQIKFHRGSRNKAGDFFGPYASSHAVYETLQLLQKIFQIRQCSDNYFRNRTRPCLQYQIKRCTGPCVGYIDEPDYHQDITQVIAFLQGKDHQLVEQLQQQMQQLATEQRYERAGVVRDQIRSIAHVREKQSIVSNQITGNLDIIALVRKEGLCCIQIAFVRNGFQYGSKSIWLQGSSQSATNSQAGDGQLMEAFMSQFYQNKDIPDELVLSTEPDNTLLLQKVFSEQRGKQVKFSLNVRAIRQQWLQSVIENANQSLFHRINKNTQAEQRLQALQQCLNMQQPPQYMECFDISHTMGTATKGSCVVFKQGQAATALYRTMNLGGITPGDDYAAIEQVLRRRYSRLLEKQAILPDLIIVDGGKGQGNVAAKVLQQLNLQHIKLVAIAKGVERKAGAERLIFPFEDNREISFSSDDTALHLLQAIRDEAHRFAITGHRNKRVKVSHSSELQDIAGVGDKIRQRLIQHFGGIKSVKKAGVYDLMQVKGVSEKLAKEIYNYFR